MFFKLVRSIPGVLRGADRRIQEKKITVSMSTIFPNVAHDYDQDVVLVHLGIITINPYV